MPRDAENNEPLDDELDGDGDFDLDALGGATLDELDNEDGEDGGDEDGQEGDQETEEQRVERLANEKAERLFADRLAKAFGQNPAPAQNAAPESQNFKPVETYDPTDIRNIAARDAVAYADTMADAMEEIRRDYGHVLTDDEIRQVRTTLRDRIKPEDLAANIKTGAHKQLANMIVGGKTMAGNASATRNASRPAPVGKQGARTGAGSASQNTLERKFARDYGDGKPLTQKEKNALRGVF